MVCAGVPGAGGQESPAQCALSPGAEVTQRHRQTTSIQICPTSFLTDLGTLEGWFGPEQGVYLGEYSHQQTEAGHHRIAGGHLVSGGRHVQWEDGSQHDFSHWDNSREGFYEILTFITINTI